MGITNSCAPKTKTVFIPISQGQNLYTQYHKPFHCSDFYEADLSITYRFQQAANNNAIAQSVFQYNPLTFQGNDIDPRLPNALIAEYYGLAPDTNTSFLLNPQIRNQIIDMQFVFQTNKVWFQVNIPLTKAQWNPTHNVITSNSRVGTSPLQSEAQTYIYNLGMTLNKLPVNTPPDTTLTTAPNGIDNTLPITEAMTADPAALGDGEYSGAYIVSDEDISDNTNGVTPLQVEDENTGSIQFSESIYGAGFSGNDSLDSTNWKMGIGTWAPVTYTAMSYTAPYGTDSSQTPPGPFPSNLESLSNYDLSDSILNTTDSVDGETPNAMQITQNQLSPASSLKSALSGEYDFNNTIKRLYGNLSLDKDLNTQNWGIADIQLWLGCDVHCGTNNHVGFYLKGVIPTGTRIDPNWLQYAFNEVIGNGRHFEFGAGLSAHYDFCTQKNYLWSCHINGYIAHMFGTKQTRFFDQINQPMSRYTLVKTLSYTGSSDDNSLNDDYDYKGMNVLGNVNTSELMVSNDVKSEAIIDFIFHCSCFDAGFGYAFTGQTAEKINTCSLKNTTSNEEAIGQISYGYKSNAPLTTLVVDNITAANETFTPNSKTPGAGASADNYPLVYSWTPEDATDPLTSDIYIKTSADVSAEGNSGAYSYGDLTSQPVDDDENPGDTYTGTSREDLFTLPNITTENTTGLMGAQILNRIFGHLEYHWESIYKPKIGLVGSYGFGNNKYFTANYWDLGLYIGCSF